MSLFEKLRGWTPPKSGRKAAVNQESAQRPIYLSGTGRDLEGLEENDTPVKVHLSEPIRQALDELASYYDGSLSAVVRHILFVNLYGIYDLHARIEGGNTDFTPNKRAIGERIAMYSISPTKDEAPPPPPDLGKNLDNFKVWLPLKMVADIDALATTAELTRSVYIREALIRHLFGWIQLPG